MRVRPPTLSTRGAVWAPLSTAGDAAAASAFVTAALQQLEEDAEDEVRSFANAQHNHAVFNLRRARPLPGFFVVHGGGLNQSNLNVHFVCSTSAASLFAPRGLIGVPYTKKQQLLIIVLIAHQSGSSAPVPRCRVPAYATRLLDQV